MISASLDLGLAIADAVELVSLNVLCFVIDRSIAAVGHWYSKKIVDRETLGQNAVLELVDDQYVSDVLETTVLGNGFR